MTKPILILDNDFISDIYGRAPDASGTSHVNKATGDAILHDLVTKYDVRVTRTVINEAGVGDVKRAEAVDDWFSKNKDKVKIYETEGFTGRNKGERSISSLFEPDSPYYDAGLPKDPSQVKFATRDQKFFGKQKNGWQAFTKSTQAVLEEGLADGTIPRAHYEAVGIASGDALQSRGGFRTPEEVIISQSPAPAAGGPAPQVPDAAETATQPKAAPVPEKTPAVTVDEPKTPAPPPESGPAKISKFVPDGSPAETVPATVKAPGVGHAGASSIGIVLGAKGLHDAIETGDTTGGAIAATNIVTSTAQATEGVLTAAGKTAPLLTKAGKFIPGVNLGMTLVDGAYQVSKEDTPEHMAERTTVVAATATTALALGSATATVAEAGVITAGVTGILGTGAAATGTAAVVVAAAPVVVTVAAVAAVAYTGEKAIEAKRAWDDVDRTIAENGAAQQRKGYKSDDGKPSVLGYKHIAVMMLNHSQHMKNENMNGTGDLARNQKGRFKIDDFKKIDMRDPKNIAELERVLKESIAREGKIIKDNDSVIPRWMRSSDSADKMTMAQMERADLVGAMQELQMYKKELREYDKAHPDDPATTAPGGAKKPAARQQAPK
ncbi:MAG: hypothetical protein ACAH83_03890 [Alphaproteobacteria bacterium]